MKMSLSSVSVRWIQQQAEYFNLAEQKDFHFVQNGLSSSASVRRIFNTAVCRMCCDEVVSSMVPFTQPGHS